MMAVTVVAFLVTLTWSINSLRLAMDARAQEDSVRLVESEIAALRTSNEVLNADYNQWDEAYLRISSQDLAWIGANYSFGVEMETSFDRLAIFDGPYFDPMSWGGGAGYAADGEHVGNTAITSARQWLRANAADNRTAVISFTALEDGVPVIYSASFIIPHTDAVPMPESSDGLPISMMGRTLSAARLTEISRAASVSDLQFTTGDVGLGPHLVLTDVGGEPLGSVVWVAARPGTDLVAGLMPLLTMVVLGCVGLASVIIFLARRTAVTLVRQEAQAAAQARTDSLTGLPNRFAFTEQMQTYLHAQRGPLAVLFIDIDDFKRINDEAGHAAGDEVVLELAKRLTALGWDGVFLARIGGDEFVAIYHPYTRSGSEAGQLAQSIADLMRPPFVTGNAHFHITASQGLAVGDTAEAQPAELVRRANVAMFHAKRAGNGHWRVYDDEMATAGREDRILEDALRRDIAAAQGFSIMYQPLVCAGSGKMLKAEALARWASVDHRTVSPDRFIPAAEYAGLIVPLGKLLLQQICKDLVAAPDLSVSVNISPVQLQSAGFLDELRDLVGRHKIAPERIELELTEGVIVDNPDAAAMRLDTIREMGFRTSLDDFGTGFSSVGYLRKMQFDTLKIDRGFLSDPGQQEQNYALIRSMIQLGHSLGQSVVCEGVETAGQAQRLTEMGCDIFQGYHFGRPMRREALPALMAGQSDTAPPSGETAA